MVEQGRTDFPPLILRKHCYSQYFSTKNIQHSKAHSMPMFEINDGNYIRVYKPPRYNLTIVTKYGKDFT